MGINIEAYRQRIGTFHPLGNKHKSRGQVNRKKFEFYAYQASRNGRMKTKMSDIIKGLGLYLVIIFLLSGSSVNENQKTRLLLNKNISSGFSTSNGNFIWMTTKQMNKLCHIMDGNRRNPGYKYFSWNCDRGFISENKLEDLKCYVFRNNPHVISVSEINLTRNEHNRNDHSTNNLSTEQVMKLFQIPGYSIILPESWILFDKARIIVYVNDEIKFKVCELKDEEKHLQTITLEIGFGRCSKHFVNTYYREWKSIVTGENHDAAQIQNLKKLMNIWQRSTEQNKDFVSLGDMNLCALSWNENGFNHSNLANIVQDFMLSENCHQLVNQVTRIRKVGDAVQRSCLDHITTNCVSKMSSPELIGLSKSDHLGISIVKKSREIRSSPKTTKKRVYKNFCKEKFLKDISEAKEKGLFEDIFRQEDIDQAAVIFTNVFKQILENHAPLQIIQNRSNYIPYVTKEIKEAMILRDQLKVEAAKTGILDDFDKYKVERNKVTYMLRNAKKNYYDEKFNDENASSSEIWKTAYSALGSFRSSFPSQVMIFGNLVSKPILLASGMNKFFVRKIEDLKGNDSPSIHPEATDVLRSFLSRKEIPQEGFKLREITSSEMKKLIKGLKGKKSCGLDWVCGFSLKMAAPILSEELRCLTNLSIRSSKFTTGWKYTKVLPGFKNKGSRYEAKFYRPISNLSEISKITERAVHNQIFEYFEKFSLFHPNHHGFLRKHSTATALQQIFDFWITAIDEGKFCGSLLLDLSAGFDVIDFEILLKKLKLYGFQEDTVSWFRSYLVDRSQCVQIESAFSPFLPIKWGVPQGSILGPLIFIIFINELPEIVETFNSPMDSSIVVFADDNTPMSKHKNPDQLIENLEVQALKVTNWFHQNKMIVSGEKTKFLVVGTQANRSANIEDKTLKIVVDGHEVIESKSEKLLGLIINNVGTWKSHLHGDSENPGLLKDLSKRIGMLKQLRKHLPAARYKMIISGIFTSKLTYGINAWGSVWGTSTQYQEIPQNSITLRKDDMRKLQVLQNSTMRLLLQKPYDTPTTSLLEQSGTLSVNQTVAMNMISQVWKIQECQQPSYHYDRLFGRLAASKTRTRSVTSLDSRINFKLSQSRGSFFYLASNLWNSLPPGIRFSSSKQNFKTNARNWIKRNIPMKV